MSDDGVEVYVSWTGGIHPWNRDEMTYEKQVLLGRVPISARGIISDDDLRYFQTFPVRIEL